MEGPRGSEIHNILPSKPALRASDLLKEDNQYDLNEMLQLNATGQD